MNIATFKFQPQTILVSSSGPAGGKRKKAINKSADIADLSLNILDVGCVAWMCYWYPECVVKLSPLFTCSTRVSFSLILLWSEISALQDAIDTK